MAHSGNSQQPFEAMLARGLDRRRDTGGRDCPEIGTLAAYFERSLPSTEVEGVERHASDCARCQGVLAAMAKTEEAGASQSHAPAWSNWRWIGIAVGVSSAALALLILFERAPMETRMAAAPNAQRLMPEVGQLKSGTAPSESAFNAPITHRAEEAPARASNESQKPEQLGESSRPEAVTMQPPSEAARGAVLERPEAAARHASASPAAVVQVPVTAGVPVAPGLAARLEAESVARAVRAIGGAAPAASPPGAAAFVSAQEQAGLGRGKPPSILVVSRDGSASWRLGVGGAVARLDQGKLWQPQNSGVNSDLLAGAAPSASVCWAVGRSGTILRTSGGERWVKLTSPTESDLTAVSAESVLSAIVTAADGRQFATSDGGSTWRPVAR